MGGWYEHPVKKLAVSARVSPTIKVCVWASRPDTGLSFLSAEMEGGAIEFLGDLSMFIYSLVFIIKP